MRRYGVVCASRRCFEILLSPKQVEARRVAKILKSEQKRLRKAMVLLVCCPREWRCVSFSFPGQDNSTAT